MIRRRVTMILVGAVVVAASLAFLPLLASAAEPTPSLADRVKSLEESKILSFFKDVEIGGFVDTSFNYNFNNPNPGSGSNNFRAFDDRANQFDFHNLELSLMKKSTDQSPAGFGVVANVGRDAQKIHSFGLGRTGSPGSSPQAVDATDIIDLQQAYVTYRAPIGSGLDIKAGKWATLLGAEVIESPNNFNFSRSLLFSFAIPFTHTGLLVSYTPLESASISLGLVNGWDVVNDNNDGKTFIGQVSYTPFKDFVTVVVNGIVGPEQDSISGNTRWILDTVLTVTPPMVKGLSLSLNYDYGSEKSAVVSGKKAMWRGIAGIVNYDFPSFPQAGIALRGEYFDDRNGARLGAAGRQKLWEITTTFHVKLLEHILARLEYRHDQTADSKKAFDDGATKKYQDTVAVEVIYLF